MKISPVGGDLDVEVDEVFGIARRGQELSGYVTEIELPEAIKHVSTERDTPQGFGASPRIVERFTCSRPGKHEIAIIERRPWEKVGRRRVVTVHCAPR